MSIYNHLHSGMDCLAFEKGSYNISVDIKTGITCFMYSMRFYNVNAAKVGTDPGHSPAAL